MILYAAVIIWYVMNKPCFDHLQVTLPDGILARWGHSVTAITLCPGLENVAMFGGSPEKYRSLKEQPRVSETTVITFSKCVVRI